MSDYQNGNHEDDDIMSIIRREIGDQVKEQLEEEDGLTYETNHFRPDEGSYEEEEIPSRSRYRENAETKGTAAAAPRREASQKKRKKRKKSEGEFTKRGRDTKKKWSVGKKIGVTFACIFGALILLAGGYYFFVMGQISRNDVNSTAIEDTIDPSLQPTEHDVNPEDIQWDQEDSIYRHEEGVINILLIGEENVYGDERGRTDSIMIATVNRNTKEVKLTSIMRDTYVQIPSYQGHTYRDNKINAAYTLGGATLTALTIEQALNIQLDGFVKVDFDGFEQVIDALGGVEITLSQGEANYLNKKNYISNPANRNVVAGTQILNGNQALGYSRVRYVATPEGVNDDYGRTLRQRKVLTAVFDKYKDSSVVDLLVMLPQITRLITTDLSTLEMTNLISIGVGMKPSKLETLRIPVDGGYSNQSISGVGDSLILNWDKNIEELHRFVFGTSSAEKAAGLTPEKVKEGYSVDANGNVVAPTPVTEDTTTDGTQTNTTTTP